ncbi:hypothetical protein CLOM_g21385 [Closterium sp. NIES-68]|nr:hypothetical protein CLOM_g21385 [Closterium sp. NIES-68]GJP82020.1 hypothetical protein CLOP_g12140 [Closterium sp. NIES-67]
MEFLRHGVPDGAQIKLSGRDENLEVEPTPRDLIYLDYNATTPIDPAVAEEMIPVLRAEFGNPSSAHAMGRRANAVVERARARVAQLLNCSADEVVFTSGGTESNNWAIKGAVSTHNARSAAAAAAVAAGGGGGAAAPHVVISAVEHPAVTEVAEHLRVEAGCEVTVVPVDSDGIVCADHVVAAVRPNTAIVSIMLANNEVGSLQPIAQIAAALRNHRATRAAQDADAAQHAQDAADASPSAAAAPRGAEFPLLHTDASQAVGKTPVDFTALGVDLLTVAAHKLYGPKGVGALVVRRGVRLPRLMHGAGHEKGRRAGTESTVLLAGLGKACELAHAHLPTDTAHSEHMRSRLLHGLTRRLCLVGPQQERGEKEGGGKGGDVALQGSNGAASVNNDGDTVRFRVNGPCDPSKRLPNTLSLSFESLHGPSLMARLLPRVACSAGAACHSSPAPSSPCPASSASTPPLKQAASPPFLKGSSVLEAMGVCGRYARCTVRVSVGRWTTEQEVDEAAEIIADAVVQLKREQQQQQLSVH